MVLPIAYQFSLLALDPQKELSRSLSGGGGEIQGGVGFGVEGFESCKKRMCAYSDNSN